MLQTKAFNKGPIREVSGQHQCLHSFVIFCLRAGHSQQTWHSLLSPVFCLPLRLSICSIQGHILWTTRVTGGSPIKLEKERSLYYNITIFIASFITTVNEIKVIDRFIRVLCSRKETICEGGNAGLLD